ncbi:MAG TPA: hypothetical protein VHG93_28870 [Longimicrobium sp.]|nr:hypothetical protein [Longimicrobium sp.]
MNRSILLAASLPLAAACGADLEPEPALNGNQDPDGVVFLAQNEPPVAYMEARYQGLVTRDAQGCLRVQDQDNAVVIWPYGSRLEARGGELVVIAADGREVGRIGGHFEMGGGFVPITAASLSNADLALARSRCPSDEYWVVGEMH